jgi:transposase
MSKVRDPFDDLMRYICMDAKDEFINELKKKLQRSEAQLQHSQAQLQRKDVELGRALSELTQTQSQLAEAATQLELTNSQHSATSEQFTQSLAQKDRELAELKHQIKLLIQRIRGSRQERINPDQLLLFSVEELQQLAKELEEQSAGGEDEAMEPDPSANPTGGKKKHGRKALPQNLPREIVRHELSDDERKCPSCGETRIEIGVESSQQLEFVPAHWKVIQHDRVKYACKCCQENVAIATKPPQPIEKGLPGPGLCAFTVLSKFGDHIPLYREEDMHSRAGRMIRRSTLCEWLFTLAKLANPLVMRMKHLLLQSQVIHTDDTKIKMLQLGTCQEAKFWPYLGDWLHRYAVYDFTLDRKRDGPLNFLQGYRGYVQADAYSGYDCVYAPGGAIEVACWIHARRYWHEALDNDAVRANTALGFIARMAQIESQLRQSIPCQNLQGLRNFEAVAAARQKYTLPILQQMRSWLDAQKASGRILPKSIIAKAFTYTNNQWEALCRFTQHGFLSMENNAAERLAKYPAIGRRNYLFVGNEQAGHNAAVFYSLVSSCKANGVEPFAWLKDIFTQLPNHRGREAFTQAAQSLPVTSAELDYLLPDRWLESHPECVWTIDEVRRKERHQQEQRRRFKRPRRPKP